MNCLLDVNLLMALLWENHEQHEPAQRWLRTVSGFATCPISQLGFARVSAHPALGYGLSPEHAFTVLRRFLGDARHRFVPDDLSCAERALLRNESPAQTRSPTTISRRSHASMDWLWQPSTSR